MKRTAARSRSPKYSTTNARPSRGHRAVAPHKQATRAPGGPAPLLAEPFNLALEALEPAALQTDGQVSSRRHRRGCCDGPNAALLFAGGKNLNSRPRTYFTLRRYLGGLYLAFLQFFLNHRRSMRSRVGRQGKSPRESMTGRQHPHRCAPRQTMTGVSTVNQPWICERRVSVRPCRSHGSMKARSVRCPTPHASDARSRAPSAIRSSVTGSSRPTAIPAK